MTRGKQSFLGGAALLTVTMLVTKAIGALYKIPLGNLLDEQGMNYFYAAYNIYNLLLMVSTAGLPLALSRLVSQAEALGWVNRRRRIVSVAFWLFLLLGLLSSGLMFFLAGDLAGWMHNTRAEDAIRVLSPAVLCVCLVSVIRGYTQGMGDMRPTAASEVIESASKLMVGLGLAWFIMKQKNDTALAAGGSTYKLKYGHRGVNQPVRDLNGVRTYITSQNHGYAVEDETLSKDVGQMSYFNANDGTCEGVDYLKWNCFTVQFHPEANGGPKDTEFLFDEFVSRMLAAKGVIDNA